MPLREHGSTGRLSAPPHGAAARTTLHVWLPEALGPLIGASFVRTLRSRPQRKPVRFTSYAATTRMRRSRSNVLHCARGSAYAAGQRHFLPPHTRKDTGSIPVVTTRGLCAAGVCYGWGGRLRHCHGVVTSIRVIHPASRGDVTIRCAQVRLGCPNIATYRETARF